MADPTLPDPELAAQALAILLGISRWISKSEGNAVEIRHHPGDRYEATLQAYEPMHVSPAVLSVVGGESPTDALAQLSQIADSDLV